MSYQAILESSCHANDYRPQLQPGASEEALLALENKLGMRLPADLRELLAESDGVELQSRLDGQEYESFMCVVWPVKKIASYARKLNNRSKKHRDEPVVFFGPGDSAEFCCGASGRVYAWYENDLRLVEVSPSLPAFIEAWVAGRLQI